MHTQKKNSVPSQRTLRRGLHRRRAGSPARPPAVVLSGWLLVPTHLMPLAALLYVPCLCVSSHIPPPPLPAVIYLFFSAVFSDPIQNVLFLNLPSPRCRPGPRDRVPARRPRPQGQPRHRRGFRSATVLQNIAPSTPSPAARFEDSSNHPRPAHAGSRLAALC